MSSLAQEESHSISENVRWGQRKKISDGKFSLNYKHFLGYDKGPDGGLVINKAPAEIGRRIYGDFLAGMSPHAIARKLTEEGMCSNKIGFHFLLRSLWIRSIAVGMTNP